MLAEGVVQEGTRGLIEIFVLPVGSDADHGAFAPRLAGDDRSAHRIFSRPEHIGHLAIDYHRSRAILAVGGSEGAASQNTNAKGGEVIGVDSSMRDPGRRYRIWTLHGDNAVS